MTIDFFWLGGTGFGSTPEAVSKAFADGLDRTRFTFHYLTYPAAYGHPLSYAESTIEGRRILATAIRNTPNRVCIGGFSQGSGIAGDLAAEIAAGLHLDFEVDAVALIADPYRPAGAGMPGKHIAPGYGIGGERRIFGTHAMPVYWAANPGDVITAAGPGSPLRTLADLSQWATLSSSQATLAWGSDLINRAKAGRWQRFWSIENWQTWGGAARDAAGYLAGRHTTDYITLGYCRDLAAAVNRGVR